MVKPTYVAESKMLTHSPGTTAHLTVSGIG
jgi:hypothetical protein